MISRIKKIYDAEQFNPRFLGIFINYFYFARKGLYKNISELVKHLNGKLLDIGCGYKPYESICNVSEYIGLEIDDEGNRNHSSADAFYDGKIIPFENDTFDSILTSQVFEHVFNPNEFLKEINRVTKKEGVMLLTVPFIWDEHEQPFDYGRYTSFGLKHILEKNGFEIIELRKSCSGVETIFQLINAYAYKEIQPKSRKKIVSRILLMIPVNIIGLVLSIMLPKDSDLYLDNIVLAKKVRDV